MSSFEERMRKVRADDEQLKRQRESSIEQESQRKSEHELKRVDLKRIWERVTAAMVQSGEEPDVLVATPEGIERARKVPDRGPSIFGTGGGQKAVQRHARKQYAAVGSLYQPAWDMDSNLTTGTGETEHTTGLFLAQDATVYTGLNKAGNFKSPDEFELPYWTQTIYPIEGYLELADFECDAIEQGLATLVVRKELVL